MGSAAMARARQIPVKKLDSFFSPQQLKALGVSAQIGSAVVQGDHEVSFHQGSTRVPPGFHQGSTRVPPGFHQGSARVAGWCEHQKEHRMLLGISPEFIFFLAGLWDHSGFIPSSVIQGNALFIWGEAPFVVSQKWIPLPTLPTARCPSHSHRREPPEVSRKWRAQWKPPLPLWSTLPNPPNSRDPC